MVQKESKLYSADNSGAKYVRCIRVFKKLVAKLGDFVLVVMVLFNRHKKLAKKKKYAGLLISSSGWHERWNGSSVAYNKNRILLFFDNDKFAGTRIYGPMCKEIREKSLYSRFKPLFSLAQRVL